MRRVADPGGYSTCGIRLSAFAPFPLSALSSGGGRENPLSCVQNERRTRSSLFLRRTHKARRIFSQDYNANFSRSIVAFGEYGDE